MILESVMLRFVVVVPAIGNAYLQPYIPNSVGLLISVDCGKEG